MAELTMRSEYVFPVFNLTRPPGTHQERLERVRQQVASGKVGLPMWKGQDPRPALLKQRMQLLTHLEEFVGPHQLF